MKPKLIEVFPEWYEESVGGIFKTLYNNYGETVPWLSVYSELDIEYYGNISGHKTISPLIDKFIKLNYETGSSVPKTLTDAQKTSLAKIIVNRYQNKWKKLYAVMSAEYNPIENYSMEETEIPDISRRHTVSDDYEVTDKKSTESNFTVSTETETENDVYGFNSSTPVPTGDATGNSKVTTQGNADENVETSKRSQTGYTEETETGTRKLVRAGNIGVTTSQHMIESEIALWQWNFFESVYKDIDKVLTLPKYDL